MKVFAKFILPVALLALPFAAQAQTDPIRVYAPDGPPQANAIDGRGIMADAALEALKRVGMTGKIEFITWKRAQDEVMEGKDLLLTGLSRTKEREDHYTWLFPVFTMDRGFATIGKPVTSFTDAKSSLKHVAVALGGAQQGMLINEGFSADQINALSLEKEKKAPEMLLAGNVDGWFSSIVEIKYALKGKPDAGKFAISPPIGNGTVQYMVCSKNCSPELAAKLKKAGEDMKADGTLDTIMARYQ
jgi:polar amino acid transport system substrate-binding protein